MNNLFDVLDVCLQEIENGADLESVLARYPDLAGELRPILKTAMKAKSAAVPEPSGEVVRRGRARLLQQAAEMREAKAAPRKRVIPAFQRLAISFSLAALMLMSGTGLLNASASALPGEKLYPVKRGWENIRLFLIFDEQARKLLEFEFENERLHEVSELLLEGRDETIEFAGIFIQLGSMTYISGVPVLLPAGMDVPADGAAVIVSGITNSQGIVEIISLELMPEGALVPEGKPVEVELESDFGPNGEKLYEIKGILDAVSTTTLIIEDITVYFDNPSSNWQSCIGMLVEVKGYYDADGRFIAIEVEGKGSCGYEQEVKSSAGKNSDDNSNTEDVNAGNDNGSDINSNGNGTNDNVNTNDNANENGNSDDGNTNDNDNSDGGDSNNEDDSNGDDSSGNSNGDDTSVNDNSDDGDTNDDGSSDENDLNDNNDSSDDDNNNDDSPDDNNNNINYNNNNNNNNSNYNDNENSNDNDNNVNE